MRYEASFHTDAPPAQVWAALTDVESWPRWMSSYTSVRRLDSGPLRIGSTAAVEQPGLKAAEFRVSALDAEQEFTWVSRAPGVRTKARHVIRADSSTGSRILLGVEQNGPLASLIGLVLGRKIRRYLQIEGRGLCAASEVGR